jgi:hypothetical protein
MMKINDGVPGNVLVARMENERFRSCVERAAGYAKDGPVHPAAVKALAEEGHVEPRSGLIWEVMEAARKLISPRNVCDGSGGL